MAETPVVLLAALLLLSVMWTVLRHRITELEKENNRLRKLVNEASPPEQLRPIQLSAGERRSAPEAVQGWEAIIGGSILNKVGAVVLAIGIALFLSYSYTHLIPAARASISAALSLAILCCGVVVERRLTYRAFARGLIGAGWAGLYATAYAMYALPATRVIADPFIGSLLLLIVAGGMIGHSLRYRAQAVTAVAYFSAFAALAATPSTSFAVISLIPLAVTLLYLARRFEWHSMALFGLAATYATCFSRGDSNAPLGVTESLFIVFWALFESFDLLRIRQRATAVPLQLLFPLNAVAFLGLSENAWATHAPHELWKMAAIAAALFLIGAFARLRMQDESYTASLTLAAVLSGLAIAGRVAGLWASVSIAVEAEILYLAGVRFRSKFLRVLGSVGLAFSLIDLAWKGYGEPRNHWTPAALLDAGLFYLNRFLWRPNLGFSFGGSALVALVLVAEFRPPYDCLGVLAFSFVLLELWLRKQLVEFRIQAYLGTGAGVLLAHAGQFHAYTAWIGVAGACAAIVCYDVTDRVFRSQIWASVSLLAVFAESITGQFVVAPVWGALMLGILLIGRLRRWPDFNWQSYTIAALILVRCLSLNFKDWLATSLAAACLYAAQFIERAGERYRSYFSLIATFILTALLYNQVSGSLLTMAWGLEAAVLLIGGFVLRERILRLEGLGLLLGCILKLFLYDLRNLEMMARILSFIALGALLLAVSWIYTRFRESIKRYL